MSAELRRAKSEPMFERQFGRVFSNAPNGDGFYVDLRTGERAFAPWCEVRGGIRPGDECVVSLAHRPGAMPLAVQVVRA